jgi:hypothetical protein
MNAVLPGMREIVLSHNIIPAINAHISLINTTINQMAAVPQSLHTNFAKGAPEENCAVVDPAAGGSAKIAARSDVDQLAIIVPPQT